MNNLKAPFILIYFFCAFTYQKKLVTEDFITSVHKEN